MKLPILASTALFVAGSLLACAPRMASEAGVAPAAGVADVRSVVLDDFDVVAQWRAAPSDGVSLDISSDSGRRGRAMRLDFDFHGGGGYAVAQRTLPIDLPENYEISFWIRGDAAPNNVEFKLVDESGDNVWWVNHRDYQFPGEWTRFTIRRRQISFAWGPLGGGELRRAASVEIAITAGSGGRGTVWLDELTLTERDPVIAEPPAPVALASSEVSGFAAANAVDAAPTTAWRSAPGDETPWLAVDLGVNREFGGLVVDWDSTRFARDYDVQSSPDGIAWSTVYTVRGAAGGRAYVFLPETETRWLRIRSHTPDVVVRNVSIQPLHWASSLNALYFAVARDRRRGDLPRTFTDSAQHYWTVIGAAAAEREALVGEDGAVEVDKGAFSLEPFLHTSGGLITWAEVRAEQSLEGGDLPIPSVRWTPRGADSTLLLITTAFVDGPADSATLVTRYRVQNRGTAAVRTTLFVAVRPLQVNPPWQFLNTPGGAAPIHHIEYRDGVVHVNTRGSVTEGAARAQLVTPVTPAASFGAASFHDVPLTSSLRSGRVPNAQSAIDSLGRASGAIAFPLDLSAGSHEDVVVAVPFTAPAPARMEAGAASRWAEARLSRTRDRWNTLLGAVALRLPPEAEHIARTLRSTQAYILINQDDAAIQPGSRSYERSWIRDGSLTSEALLRTGHHDRVRAFLEWYAPYQYANGKVPCCVDHRGADPVPEHDSHGQLIYLAHEYFRYTGDTATLRRMWPHVVGAVSYMDSLRQSRRTPEYRSDSLRHFFGLFPPSISHEGYSAKPMHSYWDDFFGLRGFQDAAAIATIIGRADTAAAFGRMAAEFRRDVMASLESTMRVHGIDWLAGAADLGDFDATSTTVALSPGREHRHLPQAALRRTFDRYWTEHQERAAGRREWNAYTPYELRTVGSFVRLGQPDRAHALLDFFFTHQRPAGWNHWAEVVWRETRRPDFIGDMPHTWVGSDFIRSVLDLFAYEREEEHQLVIGAGIPQSWSSAGEGVELRGLRTVYGPLDISVRGSAATARVHVSGARLGSGGAVIHAPFPGRPRGATLGGSAVPLREDGGVHVRSLPATIVFTY